jgi:hypothetical protein
MKNRLFHNRKYGTGASVEYLHYRGSSTFNLSVLFRYFTIRILAYGVEYIPNCAASSSEILWSRSVRTVVRNISLIAYNLGNSDLFDMQYVHYDCDLPFSRALQEIMHKQGYYGCPLRAEGHISGPLNVGNGYAADLYWSVRAKLGLTSTTLQVPCKNTDREQHTAYAVISSFVVGARFYLANACRKPHSHIW